MNKNAYITLAPAVAMASSGHFGLAALWAVVWAGIAWSEF